MADATSRIVFRVKLDRMLSKYSKEVQLNIREEVNDILKLTDEEVLSFETVELIIYYHFKFIQLKKD